MDEPASVPRCPPTSSTCRPSSKATHPRLTWRGRFRLPRRRAGIAQQYIVGKFDVPPQNAGFIGLGEEALNSSDKECWNGVALMLFLGRGELQTANAATRQARGTYFGSQLSPGH